MSPNVIGPLPGWKEWELHHEPGYPLSVELLSSRRGADPSDWTRSRPSGRHIRFPFTQQVNPNDAPGPTGPSKPTILIVEDNPDSRDAIRSLLEAYEFYVIEAENGEEGVRKALRYGPDLIVMDIMMPVMDGLSATRALRGSAAFRQVPIIALTAMAGARDLALEAGCDAYLPKPVEIPNFLDLIGRLLRP